MSRNKQILLINCDMGEWDAPHLTPCDDEIMPFVDMCNIACGGHAGTAEIIEQTIALAIKNNVKIGAHPGFHDSENFGRKYILLNQRDLYNSLKCQLEIFLYICDSLDANPFHIKAHGALYHACNKNELESYVFIETIKELCPDLTILVAPGSLLEDAAKREGLSTLSESFIDRRYNHDLSLVSRSEVSAVITDAMTAKEQFELLSYGEIITNSGLKRELISQTACIHGDNPNCVQILNAIREDV